MKKTLKYAAVALLLTFALGIQLGASAGTAEVYRDTWGVPYIYGDSDTDVAYALGYAQAEDRLSDLFINVRIAIGSMAEIMGPDYVESDYMMRLIRNEARCEEYWKTAPAEIKALSVSFLAGVQAYMDEHPEAITPVVLELKPWHPLCIMRAMILNWPLGTMQDELKREPHTLGWGSNEWSVAPSRSAENCPILLSDPHLTWEGMAVFYEAHCYGDVISEQHGYFLVGTYLMAYGHNAYVGWAPTTGGPDTADIYVMKLNPENPGQYEYDGEWRDAKVSEITILVRGADPVVMSAYDTHLGPALSKPDMDTQSIMVGASPYLEDTLQSEQGLKMLTATNSTELAEAMAMNHYMEQNFMYAGRDGDIGYIRIGQTPIRPEGYDFFRPVPGNTSKTKWLGIHPVSDLVQLLNPEQGYMQNCNTSPEMQTENSPLTPDKYPAYIYNTSWDSVNSRGVRALQVLSANDKMTKAEAMELAFDVRDPYWEPWIKALRNAGKANPVRMQDAKLKAAVTQILSWQGYYLREDRTAPLVRFWKLAAFKKVDADRMNNGKTPTSADLSSLLDALEEAIATMETTYGSTDVAWGDIIKVGRSGKIFPCSGANFGRGENAVSMRSLLSVGVREMEEGSGVYLARKGSMAMILMFFHEDGVESYTCIPWGQSAHPDSPHHMDQGEKLYSQRKFKKVYQSKEALLKAVTAKKVFQL